MFSAVYYGTATLKLSLGGVRLVTDPAFDAAGVDYGMAKQNVIRTMDAVAPPDWEHVDAVLLSHAHHPDNFDHSGRAFANRVGRILGTEDVAALGPDAVALQDWESYTLGDRREVTVTAVPAFHGPVELQRQVGRVTGFVVEAPALDGALYISGDTVYNDALREIGERFDVRTAILHFGAAKLPMLGDSALTLSARDGARLARDVGATAVIPVHYDGWMHFTQGRIDIERAFRAMPSLPAPTWLAPGVPTNLDQ